MPSSAKTPRLSHIPELDGIRGIAALMVLCHHLLYTSIPNPERWNWFLVLASRLSHAGGYGVDLFFVLSGFLITSLLVLDRGSPHYLWNFYWKRTLRILPLYLAALLTLMLVLPSTWRYSLLSLFFLANFAQLFHVASAGPFWTLAIEEQFYLIWPRFASTFSIARLQRLALGIVIASPVLRLIAALAGHHNYIFTFFHCDGLALGALLACQQLRNGSSDPQTSPTRKAFPSQRLLLPMALALIAVPLLIASRFGGASRIALIFGAFTLSGVSLLSFCLIAAAVEHTGAPLLAIFRSRALTFFGLVSYCLYLTNGYVVLLYDRLHDQINPPMQPGNTSQYVIRAAAVFATTLILCIVSRYSIELPAMSLRKHMLRRS